MGLLATPANSSGSFAANTAVKGVRVLLCPVVVMVRMSTGAVVTPLRYFRWRRCTERLRSIATRSML